MDGRGHIVDKGFCFCGCELLFFYGARNVSNYYVVDMVVGYINVTIVKET
jgi:hypothetical protein